MTEEDRSAALRLQEFLSSKGVPDVNVGVGLADTAGGRGPCLCINCTDEEAQRIGKIESFETYPVRISTSRALH